MEYTISRNRKPNWGELDPKGGFKTNFGTCKEVWCPGVDKETGELRIKFKEGEQEAFESILKLAPGTLNANSEYWDGFKVIIEPGITKLKDTVPRHKLTIAVMRMDPTIAFSKSEAENSMKTEYVITSTQDEATHVNKRREIKTEAYTRYGTLTAEEISDVLLMTGSHGSTPEVNKSIVGDFVESNPSKFIKIVSDPNFKDRAWIKRLIKKGVITKSSAGNEDKVSLFFNDIELTGEGKGVVNALNFIHDSENQELFIAIKRAESDKV